jgi:hypothetical protein
MNTGSYLQVGGGGVTCLLERRDAATRQHFRGYHDKPSKVFPDGTILAFGANKIRMAANEWFDRTMVADAFAAFLPDITQNLEDEPRSECPQTRSENSGRRSGLFSNGSKLAAVLRSANLAALSLEMLMRQLEPIERREMTTG